MTAPCFILTGEIPTSVSGEQQPFFLGGSFLRREFILKQETGGKTRCIVIIQR